MRSWKRVSRDRTAFAPSHSPRGCRGVAPRAVQGLEEADGLARGDSASLRVDKHRPKGPVCLHKTMWR
ncbi:hypothetical protein HYQ44_013094 [Verticillium longisporum]|nr:hypothetical protein HYQ44_013094 [Verticillium longisporum]